MEFFSWGRDSERNLSNRFAPPLFDGAGIGGRLAVDDSVAWRALRTEGMETLLDAAAGEAPSLSESADYVELLRLMMDHNAISIFMSSETVSRADGLDEFAEAMFPGIVTYAQAYGFTDEQMQALVDRVTGGTFPPPFDTYAVASAHDEDGFHTIVAYIYPSEELALAAQPKVEQRFSEAQLVKTAASISELYSPVVTVGGRTVLVRLNGDAADSLVVNHEPVFAHE
jgi:hypothetical protein